MNMRSTTAEIASEVHPGSRLHKAKTKGSRRSQFLRWLRKIHGWVGLWGAVLGLLFGMTGILQNHRLLLRIKTPAPQRTTVELALPTPHPQTPKAMMAWLTSTLNLPPDAPNPPRVQREPSQKVTWGEHEIVQPEHWTIRFFAVKYSVVADYWTGANTVTVTRNDNGWLSIVQNLHRSNGVGIGWVLLADTIGGSLILLSITGVILWTELNRRRVIGFTVFAVSTIALILAIAQSM